MGNQWFRMYSEFANDPKVQMMSEAYQRRFIMLLCIRCSNDDETFHDDHVAFQLRISNEEWAKTKGVFFERKLIDENNKPIAWDKRQYASDSSTARVRKHREQSKRSGNVTVTPQNTDTDTDTDTDKKDIVGKKPRQSKTRFSPPTLEEVTAYCLERNNGIDPQYWIDSYASKGWMVGQNKMQDWKASIRTWEANSYPKGRQQKEKTMSLKEKQALQLLGKLPL